MKRSLLLAPLALCVFAAASPLRADVFTPPAPGELALKDVPFAPGAPAVVLDWIIERDDDRNFENQHVRIKVLTEEGKKFANVEIPYSKTDTWIRKIQARTIQPDGTIKNFDGQTFDKLLVKVHRYDVTAKTFTLPDVRVGSILEYAYTKEWNGLGSLARWPIQRDLPAMHEHYSFKPWHGPIALLLMYIANGLPPNIKPTFAHEKYDLELNDIPAFEEEPLAPPEELIRRQITYFYAMGNQTTEEYWKTIGDSFSDDVEDFMKERPAIVAAAKEITAGAATPEEKLRKIYVKVQSLRHLSYEREKTDAELKKEKLRDNKRAEDVLRNGYGYSSELNKLFIALARAAGLQADPVLFGDRAEPLLKEIPSYEQFDHLGAVVTIDGKRRYYDPGIPYLPFGMLRWNNVFNMALIDAKKKLDWVETSDVPASQNVTTRTADLHIDGDALAGTLHMEMTGETALQHRLDLRFDDEAAQKKSLEDEVKKWLPEGSTVKLTKLAGMSGSEEPIVADFDVSAANVVSLTGSRQLLPLSVFETTAKNPFTAEKRKHPFYIDFPYEIVDAVTVQLPEGYQVETLPDTVKRDAGALTYSSESKRGDKSITFSRKLYFDTAYIAASSYPALRRFMSEVTTADQASASLRKQ